MRLQRRHHRGGLGIELGGAIKHQREGRGEQPRPHGAPFLALHGNIAHQQHAEAHHQHVLVQVAKREAAGSQAAQHNRRGVQRNAHPHQRAGHAAELIGLAFLFLQLIGRDSGRRLGNLAGIALLVDAPSARPHQDLRGLGFHGAAALDDALHASVIEQRHKERDAVHHKGGLHRDIREIRQILIDLHECS